MKKKFLDKQGLTELYKSFKDRFASKNDVPIKVSQLENDSKFQSAQDVGEIIGKFVVNRSKIKRFVRSRFNAGSAIYVESLGKAAETPCLVFTYLSNERLSLIHI